MGQNMNTVRSEDSRASWVNRWFYLIVLGLNLVVVGMVRIPSAPSDLPSDLLVTGLWALLVSWFVLLAFQIWHAIRGLRRSRGVSRRSERRRSMLWAGSGMVLGLVVGFALELLVQDALWLCDDFFTGGATHPVCAPWESVRWWLPWVVGVLGATTGWLLAFGGTSSGDRSMDRSTAG